MSNTIIAPITIAQNSITAPISIPSSFTIRSYETIRSLPDYPGESIGGFGDPDSGKFPIFGPNGELIAKRFEMVWPEDIDHPQTQVEHTPFFFWRSVSNGENAGASFRIIYPEHASPTDDFNVTFPAGTYTIASVEGTATSEQGAKADDADSAISAATWYGTPGDPSPKLARWSTSGFLGGGGFWAANGDHDGYRIDQGGVIAFGLDGTQRVVMTPSESGDKVVTMPSGSYTVAKASDLTDGTSNLSIATLTLNSENGAVVLYASAGETSLYFPTTNGTLAVVASASGVIASDDIGNASTAGKALLTAATSDLQLAYLGGGATGVALFKAATVEAAQHSIGINTAKKFYIFEDFTFSGSLNGFGITSFGGGNASTPYSRVGRIGCMGLNRGSFTANSGGSILTSAVAFTIEPGFVAEFWFSFLGATSTIVARLGFQDAPAYAAVIDGAWIDFAANGSAIVAFGKTSSNSSASTTGTSYTLGVNIWYYCRVEITAGPTAVFSIYDNAGTKLWEDSLSSNLPPKDSTRATGCGSWAADTGTGGNAVNILMDAQAVSFSGNIDRFQP